MEEPYKQEVLQLRTGPCSTFGAATHGCLSTFACVMF